MNFGAAFIYIPVIAYLLIIWVLQINRKTAPIWLHAAAYIAGAVTLGLVEGIILPLITSSAAALFFILGVYIAGRYVTRSTIYILTVTFAISPAPNAWFGVLAGMFLAAFVAFVRIARQRNSDAAVLTVYESASSLGLAGSPLSRGVDPERIPATELKDVTTDNKRMRVAPFLMAGLIGSAALAVLMG